MRNIKTFESFANEAKEDLTGKFVELKGDEGIWYEVESDNGNRVEVVAINTKLKFPPREVANKKFILQVKDSIEESIVTEKKVSWYIADIIDMLSNADSMEMQPDEFKDYCVKEFGMDPDDALDILDGYWSLGAKDRYNFDDNQWIKWLNKLGVK